jgi:hypothetical protein
VWISGDRGYKETLKHSRCGSALIRPMVLSRALPDSSLCNTLINNELQKNRPYLLPAKVFRRWWSFGPESDGKENSRRFYLTYNEQMSYGKNNRATKKMMLTTGHTVTMTSILRSDVGSPATSGNF